MPRNWKHKLGTKYRRDYPVQNMENALRGVVEQNMSFQQAAEQYGVPKTTLYEKYRGRHGDKLGRCPAISVVEEKLIVSALLTAAEFRVPFTETDLMDFVEHYFSRKGIRIKQFKNNRPGRDWVSNFLKRNLELSKRNSQNIKRCRAELKPETINEYFEHLKIHIDGVPPENIINFDETNMSDDPGQEQVFVHKKTKHASRVMDFSKTSTSVMYAAGADGSLLPPYIVYKAKYLYPDWVEGGPEGARYNRTCSGWFDADTFEDWYFKCALVYLKRKEGKKILIGDNLSSHLSYRVIRSCEENDISFIFLPTNSTHLCQPLDVAVFHPVKIEWRKCLREWKQKNRGVLPKTEFPKLIKKMLDGCSERVRENIISGFRATGISPFNPQIVMDKIKPKRFAGDEERTQRALEESFANIIAEKTKINERTVSARKRKLDVPAGKSISSNDFLENSLETGSEVRSQLNSKTEELNQDSSEADSSSENSVVEDETDYRVDIKTPNDINEGCFVLCSFIYNKNTKKEVEKLFVAKILSIKKSLIEISCLRQYKGKQNMFVFPVILDVQTVKFSQLRYRLLEPAVKRGIHIFFGDVIEN